MSMYHEPVEELTAPDRDIHRALNSLKEEIEAIDWYQQRVATSANSELEEILAHNRDEEIEHACMLLEWLRRTRPEWDTTLQTYLFTSLPITEIEEAEAEDAGQDAPADAPSEDLGIGSLKHQ
ncbi:hypothetical protein GF339_14330 [candidate division KSB3 bacterium]|uniref:Ferritin n=1 Tax=candidate division KSB3 bacterium TaxID=2044937 RepID=A0A9D5JX74_9BACT|nr:hypothetical protein [candidate division KSB3 bacterium]MBD3325760.1 hypothetical protein [candidate division KSB3 bacterium]